MLVKHEEILVKRPTALRLVAEFSVSRRATKRLEDEARRRMPETCGA